MIKNIVIEGPNNVGKTSFINYLLGLPEFKNWTVEHMTGDTPNDFTFYNSSLKWMRNVIFDRHCIGEQVYPYLYERKPKISVDEMREIVLNSDTLWIFIDADFKFINNAYKHKGETPDWEQIFVEKNQFNELYEMLKDGTELVMRMIRYSDGTYNTDAMSEHECACKIVSLMGDYNEDNR